MPRAFGGLSSSDDDDSDDASMKDAPPAAAADASSDESDESEASADPEAEGKAARAELRDIEAATERQVCHHFDYGGGGSYCWGGSSQGAAFPGGAARGAWAVSTTRAAAVAAGAARGA